MGMAGSGQDTVSTGARRAPAGADRGCYGRLRDLCWRDLLPTLKRTLLGAGEGMGNKLQGWGFSFAPFFKDAYGPDIAPRYFDDFRGRSTRPAVKAHICDLAKFDGYPANVLRQAIHPAIRRGMASRTLRIFGRVTGEPMKAFVAKVIGAAVIGGAFVCYQEYYGKRVIEDVLRAVKIAKEEPGTMFITLPAAPGQPIEIEVKASSSSDTSLQRATDLEADEACVKGEVVRINQGFGVAHEYRDSKPVKCFERSKLPD